MFVLYFVIRKFSFIDRNELSTFVHRNPIRSCLACHDRAKSVPRPAHRRLEMGPGDKDQSYRLKVQLEPSHVTCVFMQKHRRKMFCNSILFEWSTVARPARRSDTLRIKSCWEYSTSWQDNLVKCTSSLGNQENINLTNTPNLQTIPNPT